VKGKELSPSQITAMVALPRITIMMMFMPSITRGNALHDGWLAALISVGAGLILAALAAGLAARFPDDGFGHFSKVVLGRLLGAVAALLLASFYYLLVIMWVRQLSILVVSVILERTPGWVVGLSMLVAGLYGAFLGPGPLGRAAVVLMLLVGLSVVVGLTSLHGSGAMDFSYLKPVLARGWRPVMVAAVSPTFWFATTASTSLVLTRFCTRPQEVPRAVLKGTLISGLVLVLLVAAAISTFGPRKAAEQLSPVHSMARTVFLMGIMERVDIVLFTIWIVAIAFDLALFLFATATVVGDALGVRWRSVLGFLGAGIAAVASLQVLDVFTLGTLLSIPATAMVMATVHVGLVGIVFLVAAIRRQGERT